MASAKKNKVYKITVTSNKGFCGVDAGGVHFANGEATLPECRMVSWFREHEGYEVTEVAVAEDPKE